MPVYLFTGYKIHTAIYHRWKRYCFLRRDALTP